MSFTFPFSAIVGQDEMKLAILIAAVDPTVGGVLVFGDRGTGKSTAVRGLAERVSQASALLSTRVDIARERQNQALLASMDRRAKQQLRLQQTVEGLSVAAIVYYVAGLLGYAAKALHAGGMPVDPDVVVGVAIPFVAALVFWAVRRSRRRLQISDPLID